MREPNESALRRACHDWVVALTSSAWMWLWTVTLGLAAAGVGAWEGYGDHSRRVTVEITVGFTATGLAVACLVSFLLHWWFLAPRRQRDEARTALAALEREFPPHDLEVMPLWVFHDDDRPEEDRKLIVVSLRFTNRDPSVTVNLHFKLMVIHRMSHPSRGDLRHSAWRRSGRPMSKSEFPDPLHVAPMTTTDGLIIFRPEPDSVMRIDPELPDGFFVRDRIDFELEIEDYVSGATITVPMTVPREEVAEEPAEAGA